jgi:hypothetical protein
LGVANIKRQTGGVVYVLHDYRSDANGQSGQWKHCGMRWDALYRRRRAGARGRAADPLQTTLRA